MRKFLFTPLIIAMLIVGVSSGVSFGSGKRVEISNKKNLDEEKAKEENIRKENIRKENLRKENLEKERVKEENVRKENIRKENLRKENLEKERIREENTRKENIRKENLRKENLERERIREENIRKENIKKENLRKENLEKERIKEENIRKENARKENLRKENLEKERIKEENIRKENIRKENLKKESLEKERVKEENIRKENIRKENLRKENIERENLRNRNTRDGHTRNGNTRNGNVVNEIIINEITINEIIEVEDIKKENTKEVAVKAEEIKEEKTKEEKTREEVGNKIMKREEVDQKYKWNLNDIYPNWEQWEKDLAIAKELMKEVPGYKGKIKENSKDFVKLIVLEEELSKIVEKLYVYPYMTKDLNSKETVASEKLQQIEAVLAEYGVNTAWITPEILEIKEETIDKWIEENPELQSHKFGIKELFRLQKHVLDEDKEKLLSYFSQYLGAPHDIFSELSISDIKFKEVELSDGFKGPTTNGVYSKILSTNRNQEDRKKAFEALYGVYEDNKNTYCAIYRSLLQRDVALAKAKNYKSSLEKALEPKNIDVSVYHALLDSAKKNTAPLKRYVAIRKKALSLEKYHYYDNSINIVDYNREFPYDEAKEMVKKSVAPLGEDYAAKLNRAISEGWLDVFETENKRSGAYSIGVYGVHPYMLLNYQSTMDDVFTLAHELGHTLHTMLSHETQPYATSDYTIFVAEVASTFNERLLLDYMINTSTDPKEKIALLEQALGNITGTYYIQTLFANYEYQAHKLIEDQKPVTPEALSEIMDTLFKEYFGDVLEMDQLQKIIWARIPHFYNSPYYVYQYATSFASSANLYDRITNPKYTEEERKQATGQYIELLKSGGNDNPMAQLKKAGVDLGKPESFDAVGKEFDRLLDLLEEELAKLK
jgi:oligoendopeptidase F